jgi:hypothetical protein
MVLALLPTARSRTEAMKLTAVALVLPFALLAPFAIADLAGVRSSLGYHGTPGGGGLHVLVQPGLADFSGRALTGVSRLLQDLNLLLVAVTTLGLSALLRRRRVEPVRSAAILWLGVFVVGVDWFPQYLVWGLPFFLMTGWIAWTAVLLAVLLPFALTHVGVHVPALLVAAAAASWLLWVERLTRAVSPLAWRA